jgi:hypothetical protein
LVDHREQHKIEADVVVKQRFVVVHVHGVYDSCGEEGAENDAAVRFAERLEVVDVGPGLAAGAVYDHEQRERRALERVAGWYVEAEGEALV